MIFFFIFWFQSSATYIALEEPKRTVQNCEYLKIHCQVSKLKFSVQGFKTKTRALIGQLGIYAENQPKQKGFKIGI